MLTPRESQLIKTITPVLCRRALTHGERKSESCDGNVVVCGKCGVTAQEIASALVAAGA
jgi:hypothetical protein